MGCVLVFVLFGAPRVALAWLWLTHHGYVASAFGGSMLWSALGFLFLPTTTLAYAYADHSMRLGDTLSPLGMILVAFGFFIDVAIHGGGARRARYRE